VTAVLHRKDAPKTVRCFVLTISDTRTPATDTSGNAIVSALESAGHVIEGRDIVKDDAAAVQHAVKAASAEVVITTGGTGITSRDGTYEALSAMFDKTLDGFGELFRMLSYEQIGSAAMMSRACAGVMGRTAVFSLPGSEHAVRLAMEKLIIPEMGHIVRELRR
jgi:molybdopterin adenylyltransferase